MASITQRIQELEKQVDKCKAVFNDAADIFDKYAKRQEKCMASIDEITERLKDNTEKIEQLNVSVNFLRKKVKSLETIIPEEVAWPQADDIMWTYNNLGELYQIVYDSSCEGHNMIVGNRMAFRSKQEAYDQYNTEFKLRKGKENLSDDPLNYAPEE